MNKETKFLDTFLIEEVKVTHKSYETKIVTIKLPYNSLETIMNIVESYETLINENIREGIIRKNNPIVNEMYEKYKILLKMYE